MNHIATRWQITLAADTAFATPIIDEFSSAQLLTYVASGLTPSTAYLIRADYYFDDFSNSGFGTATSFTTLAANLIAEPGTLAAASQGCGDC